MTSCSVSNSGNRGVYIETPPYYYSSGYCSVKESNFTQTKRPLYISFYKVEIAFNRFHDNFCGSNNDCATIQGHAYQSMSFYGKTIFPTDPTSVWPVL